jgi:hypothetical protein
MKSWPGDRSLPASVIKETPSVEEVITIAAPIPRSASCPQLGSAPLLILLPLPTKAAATQPQRQRLLFG